MTVEGAAWTDARVLVTGAGGFIGSHLVERLLGLGARVRALVHYNSRAHRGWLEECAPNDRLEVMLGDVRDLDSVVRAVDGCEVVFHLAALIGIPYSYHAPRSYVDTNVGGTLNLLQAARSAAVARFVHTSTSEVYGSARTVPMTEEHPLQAQSPYAASKVGADMLVRSFARSYGLPTVTVRPFNTYGPRQSSRAVIPTIMTQALAGREVKLGNLEPTRDLVFVSDTVEGFLRLSRADGVSGRVFNVGTGTEISIAQLAEAILKEVGGDSRVTRDPRRVRPDRSEVERLCADTERLRRSTGWTPQVSLAEGLAATLDWFRERPDRPRSGEYAL